MKLLSGETKDFDENEDDQTVISRKQNKTPKQH